MTESYQNFVTEVCNNKNVTYLTGKSAQSLLSELEKESVNTKWSAQLINQYQNSMRLVIDQAIAVKKKFFQPFIH